MMVVLFPNEKKKHSFELAIRIREFFEERGVGVAAEDEKAEKIGSQPLSQIDPTTIDFLISMGGDGTLLRIMHRFSHLDAPILGMNLGHLGFMADVPIADIFPSLCDLLDGAYSIEERLILEGLFPGAQSLYAVNDLVFHRGQNYSLIEIAIEADGFFVNTFVADGIIFSTPTGSTAYSLAAGGPILTPSLDVMLITPICPHTISNRPLVLSANRKIRAQYISGYSPIDVRADGLDALFLKSGDHVTIQRAQRVFRIVNLHRHEYFTTLRTKLGWSGKLP